MKDESNKTKKIPINMNSILQSPFWFIVIAFIVLIFLSVDISETKAQSDGVYIQTTYDWSCMWVEGSTGQNGSRVHTRNCDQYPGRKSQWSAEYATTVGTTDYFTIRSQRWPNKCLDLREGTIKFQIWSCDPTNENQLFTFYSTYQGGPSLIVTSEGLCVNRENVYQTIKARRCMYKDTRLWQLLSPITNYYLADPVGWFSTYTYPEPYGYPELYR